MSDKRIGVIGASGRMGRMIIQAIKEAEGAVLAGGTVRPESDMVGRDLGEIAGLGPLNVEAVGDPLELLTHADALIDFTTPEVTCQVAELAAQARVPMVIGTTGLGQEQEDLLGRCAVHVPIVHAANMSLGVNLLLGLVERVAGALGPDYDIEIQEMHHRNKVDAPSGTALALGKAAAEGRGVDLERVAQRTRDGHVGARKSGDIGFATLRGGDVVGEHTVIFAGPGERVEISHKAASRMIFASGAVRAALWACGKHPGLYSMKDVLEL